MWNRIKWLPLAMISVVYPLIAGLEILDIPFMEFAWFPNVVQWTDVFLVRRKVFIYAMAAIILVLIVWKYREYMKDKCLWPLLGYAGWNVLSTVLSEYREYGLHGIMESQETLFVLN